MNFEYYMSVQNMLDTAKKGKHAINGMKIPDKDAEPFFTRKFDCQGMQHNEHVSNKTKEIWKLHIEDVIRFL